MNLNTSQGGEDTVHISLYCKWSKEFTNNTLLFDAAKEVQQYGKNREESEDSRTATVSFEEMDFYVRAHGYNADREKHAQQAYYHYDLVSSGIRFCLSEREFDEDTPNARIEIGSIPLMIWGLHNCWKIARRGISLIGGKIKKNTLGRVDACVDLPGVSVETLQWAFLKNRIVSRAKKKAVYHNLLHDSEENPEDGNLYYDGIRSTGIMIGKSKFAFRGYDKVIETAHNEEKRAVVTEYRWGGKVPEVAMRGEFQIRRDGLRELKPMMKDGTFKEDGIVTVEDWIEYRYQILMYLCNSWLRFYKKDIDRTHTSRLTEDDLLPVWRKLIAAFESWTTNSANCEYNRVETARLVKRYTSPLKIESFALWRGALGNARAALARQGIYFDAHDPKWKEKVVSFMAAGMFDILDLDGKKKFFDKQEEVANRINASTPLSRGIRYKGGRFNQTGLSHVLNGLLQMASCGAGDTEQPPRPTVSADFLVVRKDQISL